MRIGNLVLFEQAQAPPTDEIGYAANAFYSANQFERYNPDALIGRKGAGIYRKMLRDDQLKSLSAFLKGATLARGFDFEIDEEHPDAERQKEFAAWARAMLQGSLRGSWLDAMWQLQTAHDFGFAMAEKIYQPWEYGGRSWWGLRKIKLRPFDTFRFTTDKHGNLEKVTQHAAGEDIDIAPARFIHYVNQTEIDEQYGQSDLRECYRAWWSKDLTHKFQNIFLERMSGGFVWIRVIKALSAGDKNALDDLLKALQSGSAFRIPQGVEFNVEFPEANNNFESAIAQHDKAMAKALLVPNLLGISEQGQTGSYSQSQTQLEAFFFTLDARAQRLAEALTEQLFRDLARWNFGIDSPPYAPLPMTEQAKMELAKTYGTIVQQGGIQPDLDAENYARELINFPAREEGDAPARPAAPEGKGGVSAEAAPTADATADMAEGSTWLGRVNFDQMEKGSMRLEERTADALGEGMLDVQEYLNKLVPGLLAGSPVAAVTIPKRLKQPLQRSLLRGLRRGWSLGELNAARELPVTGQEKIAAEFADAALEDGMQFLTDRSFTSVGTLTEDTLKRFREVIMEAIKSGKSIRETVAELDAALGEFIPTVDAAGRVVNRAARLETIARTTIFEAINEGRMDFFTQPDLEGYVEAFEYSAIIDSRTSDICDGLDGFIAPIDDPIWKDIKPPNHFNCRSILVPITVEDQWSASGKPGAEPAEGFGTSRSQT